MAELLRGKETLPFDEVEARLAPLLKQYAPPVQGRHQPELPYWHLCSDGLWEIPGAETLPKQSGGFPQMAGLRQTSGQLTADFKQALRDQTGLLEAAVTTLLDTYFPTTLHAEIVAVDNGLAIEPTLHKLLDAGAWTLTDDRRVLVSAELTGSDETVSRIRSLHGQPVRSPLPGVPPVSVEYIRWHRDEKLGGVFRHPALPL